MQHKELSIKKKLFIIADAGVDTGFAQVTHNLVDHLSERWDVHIMAINYFGDPHPIQSKARLYNPSARQQGDYYGTARVKELLHTIKPDVIFLINDPWVAKSYVPLLKGYDAPKVLYTPIDGLNIDKDFVVPLNDEFKHVVGYTHFGIEQLRLSGLTTATSVIPHGVNKKIYKPVDKHEARARNNFSDDWFIVNVTDRNQIRKRIDLALHYFATWVHRYNKPDSVKIHYHGAIQDEGWDVLQLAEYLGINDRLIITAPNITAANGLPLELMPFIYGVADVGLSTTMGEGWGLTTHERMAMKIPMIVPQYSALGEWAKGGVHYVKIADIPYYNIRGLNTRGGIADMEDTIQALETMYVNKEYRALIAEKGYKLATSKQFEWRNIAQDFNVLFRSVIHGEE